MRTSHGHPHLSVTFSLTQFDCLGTELTRGAKGASQTLLMVSTEIGTQLCQFRLLGGILVAPATAQRLH